MRMEIEAHKELELNRKDSTIEMLERKLKAMEKKKNELNNELKKTKSGETTLKAELKNCQEQLAESCKKVSSQTAEIITQKSSAQLIVNGSQDDDRDEQIKCISCDFNARNKHLLNQHMNIQHKSETKSVCNACSKDYVSNEELELHMVADHSGDIDCSKCNKMFRTEQDVYDHSNSSCSEIIGPNTCHK